MARVSAAATLSNKKHLEAKERLNPLLELPGACTAFCAAVQLRGIGMSPV